MWPDLIYQEKEFGQEVSTQQLCPNPRNTFSIC